MCFGNQAATTRGKNLVIIIGQKKALSIAVRDNKGLTRYTKLREWLCAASSNISNQTIERLL